MTIGSQKASALLFFGDIFAFALSLWVTLLLRYGEVPTGETIATHLAPFSFLFVLWVLVFFMSGLYEKRAIFFKRDLSGRIVRTQVVNIVLAALFFFFLPAFGITPKTNLAIYLVISLVIIFIWRLIVFPRMTERRAAIDTIIIGSGEEARELKQELDTNTRYGLACSALIAPAHATLDTITRPQSPGGPTLLIVDTRDPASASMVPHLYRRAFEAGTYQIVDLIDFYEEVFDRVPLSLVSYEWFFRYVTRPVSGFYLITKRLVDITGALLMGVVTVCTIPFVWLALRVEGPGPLLITQYRIGQHGTRVRSFKFRTMLRNDAGSRTWVGESENRVTRVGAFLRKTSLDEFPQCINVFLGELSLIGPRNDIEGLGERLAEALPYYRVRYIAKPGITGWAQVNQQYEQGNLSPQSIEETKVRLAYDFYYLKHRSFMLDITIALKTVKRMLFRLAPL